MNLQRTSYAYFSNPPLLLASHRQPAPLPLVGACGPGLRSALAWTPGSWVQSAFLGSLVLCPGAAPWPPHPLPSLQRQNQDTVFLLPSHSLVLGRHCLSAGGMTHFFVILSPHLARPAAPIPFVQRGWSHHVVCVRLLGTGSAPGPARPNEAEDW